MPYRLDSAAADFSTRFDSFVNLKRDAAQDVSGTVRDIIAEVRAGGDAALFALTARLDRFELSSDNLRLTAAEIDQAYDSVPAEQIAALEFAARRIEAYHRRQLPRDDRFKDAEDVELGHRWTAVAAAGIYVPGGLAAYPSSLLMNAVPAKVAGVERIAMTVPAPDGVLNPLILAAAKIAGITEIYRLGGAQAIAALAFGTASVVPVDKIVGPGNAYVAEAKRQVFGRVGIDMIAGPSEILVVSDQQNQPDWIAADLLSQAEHDEVAQSILICDDAGFADQVAAAVDAQLEDLSKAKIARESWRRHGAIIRVDSLINDAPALIDRIAPEHLALAVDNAEDLLQRVHHAGTIFLGRHTPEAIGDYVAGTNHILPTDRTARFFSGLTVLEFMKRTSLVRCSPAALARLGPAAIILAKAEGLTAHANSIAIRLSDEDLATPDGTEA